VVETVDRARLVAVQTPQGFEVGVLREAHDRWEAPGDEAGAQDRASAATDDAGMVEAMGVPVSVVPGVPEAMKITRPLDLAVAELLLDGGGTVPR
jgi:2-C-methyl-D-erythritol 4-phosphate cytidylyltransferase